VSSEWNKYSVSNRLWKYLTEIDLKIKFDILEVLGMDWRKVYFGLIGSRWRWRRATSRQDSYDEHFKTIIVGDKKTGKSSVLLRLARRDIKRKNIKKYVSKFEMSNVCTTMMNIASNQSAQLQIYDSNIVDMSTYIKACRNFMTLCHAVIIVYSVDKKRTFFNAINKWLTMIQKRRLPCNVFLVANKCDVNPKRRMVTTEEAAIVSRSRNLHYVEVSAANGKNCEDLLTSMCNIMYRRLVEQQYYESLWPDILTAQNMSRPHSIRFFHTVVPIQERPSVNEKDYRDVYTYDSDYSDEENDKYIGYTPLQMIMTNRAIDEQIMVDDQVVHMIDDKQTESWMDRRQQSSDRDVESDENYEGSDAEDDVSTTRSDDSHGFYGKSGGGAPWNAKKSYPASPPKTQQESPLSWVGKASVQKKYQSYSNDSAEEESSGDDSDENVGDEDVPLSSFRAAEQYHPAFKLNSVVREDKGIKTKAVDKLFKATEDEDHSDNASSVEFEQKAGLKHLGSGLIDGYLLKTMNEEQKKQNSL